VRTRTSALEAQVHDLKEAKRIATEAPSGSGIDLELTVPTGEPALKQLISKSRKTLDDILPEVFATVRRRGPATPRLDALRHGT